MAKDYTQLAKDIVRLVGTEKNIISLTHCVTRLRFKLKDESLADKSALTSLDGVLKVLQAGGQYQVVIGKEVDDVYDAILQNTTVKVVGEEVVKAGEDIPVEKMTLGAKLVDMISGIFLPFMGALTGAGLLKGFLVLFTTIGWLDKSSTTHTILYAAADCVFYFIPIFLAYCAGKKFGAKPFLSMAIAAAMVYPSMTALKGAGDPVTFFGIPVQLISYTSSVLPIVATCYVQSKFEALMNKFIPKIVRGLFIPLLDLVFLFPVALIVIGPITDVVGKGMANVIAWALVQFPPVAGFAMAALWPVMIIFGLHWGFSPIVLNNMAVLGNDPVVALTVGCNFGIGAACLAVFLKTKNAKLRETAGSAAVSALVGGVTEPGIYGVLLKYKRPMIIMCLVNGIGGAICATFHMTRTALMSINVLTIPAIGAVYGGWALVAIAISIVGSFVLTYLFGFNDKMLKDETQE